MTGRLAALGADLLIGTLPAYLRSDIQPQPQEAGATYAPRINKEDGQIDWTEPARPDCLAPCARTSRGLQPTRPGTG